MVVRLRVAISRTFVAPLGPLGPLGPRELLGLLGVLAVVGASCRPAAQPLPLYAAGTPNDDGHGALARASAQYLTAEAEAPDGLPEEAPRRRGAGGEAYGGAAYGGAAYGGATYATYNVPPWGYPSVNRTPPYAQKPGLTGAVEGTVTWRGELPRVTSRCGEISPLAIGGEHGVADVLVYIDHVSVGRVMPRGTGDQRPALVGGVVVKRGCALLPSTQVVTPVPAQLAIHGDATATRLQVTQPGGAHAESELQEGGRVALQLAPGVTRVEAEDGSLGAAWVIGLATPYYAITDDAGRFRIDELATGTYELTFWQPPIPTVTAGKLIYGAPVLVRRTLRIDAARTARLDVTLGR